MINVTQSISALSQIEGLCNVYEVFNGLHSESFVLNYKNLKCTITIKNNDIITFTIIGNNCSFKRSWSLLKQENIETFINDLKFFFKDTERKIA